jgi:hypothetical protein
MKRHWMISAVLLFAGCVSTNAVRLGSAQNYPRVPAEQVQVFLTEEDVKVPFEKVALINASAESGMTNEAKMIKAMQKKAGALGANAIILGDIKEPSAGAKVAGAFLGTGAQRKGSVTAIRILTEQEK